MSRDKEKKPKKKKERGSRSDADVLGIKSIQFRTWLSFVTLTAITLVIMWFAQILFYTVAFQEMNKIELDRAGDKLVAALKDDNYEEMLRAGALGGGYSALILSKEGPLCYASPNGSTALEHLDAELFGEIVDKSDEFFSHGKSKNSKVYVRSVEGRGEFIVYACNIAGEGEQEYYLCLIKPFLRQGASVSILRNQLVLVTIICLLLSMLLALTFSKKITQPIAQFSLGARKLAKGDFSVKFSGNGMTEIDELAETLNYATEEMSKTEQIRRDFFANVSHDLRTPLTMVRAYAEMIKDVSGGNAKKREEHAKIIMDEADRLTLLVGDILDLSRLQSGTNERHEEKTDLGALTKAVIQRFDGICRRDGYTLSAEIAENATVLCDVQRMEQVLYNLIGNAMNYTGEDKKISVEVQVGEGSVKVRVSDSGNGIAKDELDSVWDRYYRSSQAKRATVGTGLGLSIVKNILIQHGAKYGVESVTKDDPSGLPSGTSFWFELPRADS